MAGEAGEGQDSAHQTETAEGAANGTEADEAPPRGTLLLSVLFLVVLAGAWWLMYFVLIERG